MSKPITHKLSCGCEVETFMHGHDEELTVKHCQFHSAARHLYNALKLFQKNEQLESIVEDIDFMAMRQIKEALRAAEKGLSEEEIKALFWNGRYPARED